MPKQLIVRMSDALHRRLKLKSVQEGKTMAAIINDLVKRYLQQPAKTEVRR